MKCWPSNLILIKLYPNWMSGKKDYILPYGLYKAPTQNVVIASIGDSWHFA